MIGIHSAALTNKPAIRGMTPIVNRADSGADDEALAGLEPMVVLRSALALPGDAGVEDVLVAASRRLVEMREDAQRTHIDQRINEAVCAGKLVESQRAWAEALVAREESLFDEWFRTAPVVIPRGATTPPSASHGPERRTRAAEARARSEYRTNPLLGRLTSETAYVGNAVRDLNGASD
jgi:phage I-like protein